MPRDVKLVLLLTLWREMAVAFDLGANGAFLASLAVVYAAWFVRRLGIELAGMSDALTAAFLVRGGLWLLLYGLVHAYASTPARAASQARDYLADRCRERSAISEVRGEQQRLVPACFALDQKATFQPPKVSQCARAGHGARKEQNKNIADVRGCGSAAELELAHLLIARVIPCADPVRPPSAIERR